MVCLAVSITSTALSNRHLLRVGRPPRAQPDLVCVRRSHRPRHRKRCIQAKRGNLRYLRNPLNRRRFRPGPAAASSEGVSQKAPSPKTSPRRRFSRQDSVGGLAPGALRWTGLRPKRTSMLLGSILRQHQEGVEIRTALVLPQGQGNRAARVRATERRPGHGDRLLDVQAVVHGRFMVPSRLCSLGRQLRRERISPRRSPGTRPGQRVPRPGRRRG